MSDQDRGWHASCFQKFFRSLFIEEIKAERPYGHRNKEREKLTGAKRILRIVHDNIQGSDNCQQGNRHDTDPIQQHYSVRRQEAHLEKRRERDVEQREIPLPDHPNRNQYTVATPNKEAIKVRDVSERKLYIPSQNNGKNHSK